MVDTALNALQEKNLIRSFRRVGGAGFKVLCCLEGAAAYVFASGGCKKWDTAAPEAVLLAAGLIFFFYLILSNRHYLIFILLTNRLVGWQFAPPGPVML